MNQASKFLTLLVFIGLVYAGVGCKSTSDTTSKNKNKTEDAVVVIEEEADTSEPKSLTGLGSLGGSAKAASANEAESGMAAALPFDPNVRTGTLDNGMVYYIRKNAKPENRISLRLAVNAGSMQEDDNQQGLAHFVEHMAFNGTTNFEKNELISFLESTGVRFGADLNAYTGFDETVYMLELPTDKEGLVDKGLLVMSDWATGIAFEGEEIDKERGVIQSEWRTRLGANERMQAVWLPKLVNGNRYANRNPIGLMEIIQNAPHERFRSFYKDWYRPNLQAIVVVGDLDVDEMEEKIKQKFSALKNPENPREKILHKVPEHDKTFVAVASDKEASDISVSLITAHPVPEIKTLVDYRIQLVRDLYTNMLGSRLDELTQQKDAPFLVASNAYTSFVRANRLYVTDATARETSIRETLKSLVVENQRVLQHGFTDAELQRQKLVLEKDIERSYKERDKITSDNLAMSCVRHFLNEVPVFDIEKERQLVKEFLPTITLDEVNALAKEWVTDKNRTVIITAPDKESVKLPTEEEVLTILEEAERMKVEPYKDKFLDLPLMEKMPTPGKVVDTQKGDAGVTEYKMSNGVRVILKPTTFKNDQILLRAYSPGGHSLYDDKDFMTAQNAANIIDQTGLGKFDLIALEKKLTGATVSMSPYIGELYEGFSGSSSVEDFETMLKLVHLYATNPRKDKEAFDRIMDQTKEELRNLSANPFVTLREEITKVRTGNHPRRKVLPTNADIDQINYERMHEIYADRFADFSDFTFVLVGNFEPEKIKPQLELYLGSLPSINRKENWKDVGIDYPKEGTASNVKKGLAPQASVYLGFVTEEEWSLEKAHRIRTLGSILAIMVRENLREDKGGVYSPTVRGNMSEEPTGLSDMFIFFQCAPEDVEDLVAAAKEEVKSLQENGPSEENLEKVRETQRRSREKNFQENGYWMGTITNIYRTNRNLSDIKKYDQLIENFTKEEIQAAAKQFLNLEKSMLVTVKPEEEVNERP